MQRRTLRRRDAVRGIAAGILTSLLAACGGANGATATRSEPGADIGKVSPTNTTKRIVVAATTTQIQDLAANVGGSLVSVAGILKPNVDPHDYEPNVSDATTIAKAGLVLVHGIGLDAWMDKTVKNASRSAPIIVTTDGITLLKGDDNEPAGDPHVWFDPALVKLMVTNIAAGLVKIDSANAATYQQNAAAYNAKLDQMDQQLLGIFNQVPENQRKLVTNHDAFRYLARRYKLTIVGTVIPSLSDPAEPSAKELNTLIETIEKEHVRAIFAESSANPKVVQQVGQETGVTIVDTLYGDTLGAPGSEADTYIKMMVYDAPTIANARK
jgi:ABC-type Zn uptake system ZnuABC Zn-binding protein ZnuA